MEEQERKYHISVFAEKLSILVHELETHVQDKNGEWLVKGFIDLYKNIYTISSDTKIISKILEIYLFPIFMQFAEENGYKIVLAEKQNYYPDLTFISENNEGVMFALDFKQLSEEMVLQLVLLWEAMDHILRKETKRRIFNFRIITTQVTFV